MLLVLGRVGVVGKRGVVSDAMVSWICKIFGYTGSTIKY